MEKKRGSSPAPQNEGIGRIEKDPLMVLIEEEEAHPRWQPLTKLGKASGWAQPQKPCSRRHYKVRSESPEGWVQGVGPGNEPKPKIGTYLQGAMQCLSVSNDKAMLLGFQQGG